MTNDFDLVRDFDDKDALDRIERSLREAREALRYVAQHDFEDCPDPATCYEAFGERAAALLAATPSIPPTCPTCGESLDAPSPDCTSRAYVHAEAAPSVPPPTEKEDEVMQDGDQISNAARVEVRDATSLWLFFRGRAWRLRVLEGEPPGYSIKELTEWEVREGRERSVQERKAQEAESQGRTLRSDGGDAQTT